MMVRSRIETYLRRIAVVASLIITVAPGAGYYLVASQHLAGQLEIEAQAKAALVGAYIARNPGGWHYQTEKLQELLLGAVTSDHATRLTTQEGRLVAEIGARPKGAFLVRSAPVFDFGIVAGRIDVQADIAGIGRAMAWIMLIGGALGILVFLPMWRLPIKALRQVTDELKVSEHQHRLLVDALVDGVLMIDRHLIILQSNPAAARILGTRADALDGRALTTVLSVLLDDHETPVDVENFFRAVTLEGQLFERSMVVVAHDGTRRWVRISGSGVGEEAPGAVETRAVAISLTDISDRVAAEKRVRFLSSNDALTSLPNRTSLIEQLEHQVARSRRHQQKIAVLFVDLDHFKDINDSLGHEIGDQVLLAVATRLKSSLRQEDFVARVGGDEFVVIAVDVDGPHAATTVAAKLLSVLSTPYPIAERTLNLTPSIGISVFPEDGDSAQALLTNADVAMDAAKQNGRSSFLFYASSMNEVAQRRLEMTSAIRRGLEDGEFQLYFQPKILAEGLQAVGAEALLRWKRGERGFVSPAEFIPVAEESRLIVDIGRWVLAEANRLTTFWEAQGHQCLPVAVNVSAMQFRLPEFIELLKEIGPEGARRIDLEITESVMLETPEIVIQQMNAIKAMGFSLSLDDFGTGYSSLSYLTRFPLRYLKIDQSFVRRMTDDAAARAIVEAIIRLAQAVGLKVIAEGVETEAEADLLRQLKCDQFQGYYFARPMPAADYLKWLVDWREKHPPG